MHALLALSLSALLPSAALARPVAGPPPALGGAAIAGGAGGALPGNPLVPANAGPVLGAPGGAAPQGQGFTVQPLAPLPGQQVGQQPPAMPGQQQQQPGLGAPLPPTTTPLMMPTVSSCAAVPLGAKVDCGFPGITPDECITVKRCCFDMTDATSPWCFFPQVQADGQLGGGTAGAGAGVAGAGTPPGAGPLAAGGPQQVAGGAFTIPLVPQGGAGQPPVQAPVQGQITPQVPVQGAQGLPQGQLAQGPVAPQVAGPGGALPPLNAPINMQLPLAMGGGAGACNTPPAQRTDAGHLGITKEACLAMNACWDDAIQEGNDIVQCYAK